MSSTSADVNATIPFAQADRHERLAAVLDQYLTELESGGIPPDLEATLAEHPDLATEIRAYVESLRVLHQMTAGLRPPSPPVPTESHPARANGTKQLGDYEILREIGRGGMGIVYEARQLSLNRQVALKVLPFAAMLDEKQIARFRNEAQAAAQLHHPNIVPVHAVGQERGVHFFAMQFIAGQSLEAAINELRRSERLPASTSDAAISDSAALSADGTRIFQAADTVRNANLSTRASTRDRDYCRSVVRLIIQAADAIQHAHEVGVIHRDVKPSNLLLDRTSNIWVTDFGLARIQSDSGVTISGDVVGTLRYMSPEQAAGNSMLVDARTDVYSLGATLYELLTLEPVHLGDNRQELLRYIEISEPMPPRAINPALPVDLETVVLRSLAKNRDERYASAKDFADDLRAFLDGKPTMAQRPTAMDRLAKWAIRRRRAVIAAGAALLTLTVVLAVAAVLIAKANRDARHALRQATNNFERAEEHYQQAREVVDRFGAGLAGELAAVPGAEPVRRQLLEDTLDYYQQFISHAAGDSSLVHDLASAYFKAAAIAETLGDRAAAIDLSRKALTQFSKLARESDDQGSLTLEHAKAHNNLGLLMAAEGDAITAEKAYKAAITSQRTVVRNSEGEMRVRSLQALAKSHSNLGLLYGQTRRRELARKELLIAIGLIDESRRDNADDPRLLHDLAISYNNLSFVEREEDWLRSEQAGRKAIELLREIAEREFGVAARSDLAVCYNNLAAILCHREAWGEACQAYREAIDVQESLTRKAPAVVQYRRDLAVSWNNLGQALDGAGDSAAALGAYRSAEGIVKLLARDYPNEISIRSLCGAVLNNLAMSLEATGNNDDALEAYAQAIVNQRLAYERSPATADFRDFLSKHYFNYGRALRTAGKPVDAAEMAMMRSRLWADNGERLGQVAAELAMAASQIRAIGQGAKSEAAERVHRQLVSTLRKASAAGCNLEDLRTQEAFLALPDQTFWLKLKTQN